MANELRKDYVLDRWVIVATGRGKRPDEFRKTREYETKAGVCYFCPGNESMTPPEISRVREGEGWSIRVFPNKFPAVTLDADKSMSATPAYGEHDVIVETPQHDKGLSDLPVEHLARVLEVYSQRIEELSRREGIAYVMAFKNWGREAGASLEHTHTQLVSTPFVPKLVKEELEAARVYKSEKGSCPYCDAWKKEVSSERLIMQDENIAAFTPYASRVPMEAWIMPKRHVGRLKDLGGNELSSMAAALKTTLGKLKGLGDTPYNYYLHISPENEDYHMHIEILPKMAVWAGFELGSEVYINTLTPEAAAEYYRRE